MVEHLIVVQTVTGSSPVSLTKGLILCANIIQETDVE